MAELLFLLYLLWIESSTWAIGALNSMDKLLYALKSFPGGNLVDRIDRKLSFQLFTGITLFGYLIVILIPIWQAVIAAIVFSISWAAVSLSAIIGLVSKAVP